jgi:SP family myo-inositol transporter-like MFS transporter 13
MPETPRWLVRAGKLADARIVVRRVAGSGPGMMRMADVVVKEIEMEVREEEEARKRRDRWGSDSLQWLGAWRELLAEGKNRRALAIACLLQGLQQLCGFVSGIVRG